MKVIYIANARIPTEKAHGKQIIKTCEAFAKNGTNVELWLPERKKTEDLPFDYYRIEKKFSVKKIFSLDFFEFFLTWPKVFHLFALILQEGSFCLGLMFEPLSDGVVYTRSLTAAAIFKIARHKKVFYEIHNLTGSNRRLRIYAMLYRKLDGIVVISNGLRKALSSFDIKRILVSPDGVDLSEFSGITKEKARKLLNFSKRDALVVYSGSFHLRKGAYTLAQCAKILSSDSIRFIFVGGTKDGDLEEMTSYLSKNDIQNVTLTGFVNPRLVPSYLRAADVLVLPSSSRQRESREFTSPMKLFEYLAAGVPILASNTPANAEILIHEYNSYLVEPDNGKDLAKGLLVLLKNKPLAKIISGNAKRQAGFFSWNNRIKNLLDFMNNPE